MSRGGMYMVKRMLLGCFSDGHSFIYSSHVINNGDCILHYDSALLYTVVCSDHSNTDIVSS